MKRAIFGSPFFTSRLRKFDLIFIFHRTHPDVTFERTVAQPLIIIKNTMISSPFVYYERVFIRLLNHSNSVDPNIVEGEQQRT